MKTALLSALLLSGGLSLAQAAPIDDLILAADRNDGHNLSILLLRGVNPNLPDERGRFALHVALREESGKAVNALLAYPALDVNQRNANGETPLMMAALKGKLDWVKQLVERGARINQDGWTPLHYACSGPDDGVAAWLLSQGADINARSPNGSTPLMMASRYGGITTAEILLKAGADAGLRNEQQLTAVDFARAAGRDGLVRLLGGAAPR